jgi:hypothetical protein
MYSLFFDFPFAASAPLEMQRTCQMSQDEKIGKKLDDYEIQGA